MTLPSPNAQPTSQTTARVSLCIWGEVTPNQHWIEQVLEMANEGHLLFWAAHGNLPRELETRANVLRPVAPVDATQLEDWLISPGPQLAGATLVLNTATRLARHALARLADSVAGREQAWVVSPLSPLKPSLTPLPEGAHLAVAPEPDEVSHLVDRLNGSQLFDTSDWLPMCCAFTASALPSIAGGNAMRLGRTRRMLLADAYADTPGAELRGPPVSTDPRYPAPAQALDELRLRLFEALTSRGHLHRPVSGPVILHLLHDWGGGSERWVRDMANADTSHRHLLLRARGHHSRRQNGEYLELTDAASGLMIDNFALTPAIVSTSTHHPGYVAVLNTVCATWSVRAIVVSSMIGHSLDAFQRPEPMLVMAHDYYPLWPLLGIDPGKRQRNFDADRLVDELAATKGKGDFAETSPSFWLELRQAYLDALLKRRPTLITPTHCVMDNLKHLAPELGDLPTAIIGHGVEPLPRPRVVPDLPAPGERLTLLLAGRVRDHKGAYLLNQCLPQLLEHADLILLGAGKEAESFFGLGGVHIVMDYRLQELPRLVETFRPHAALMLPTLAETFSYTLSELWALGLPVLATRLGALGERIVDGRNGMLFDPDPESVLAVVSRLRNEPQLLEGMREAIATQALRTRSEMLADHLSLLPELPQTSRSLRLPQYPFDALRADSALRLERLRLACARQANMLEEQQRELDGRAKWARDLEALAADRLRWAESLQGEVARFTKALNSAAQTNASLEAELDERTRWARSLEQQIEALHSAATRANAELDERSRWAKSLEQQVDERTQWARRLDRELQRARETLASFEEELARRTVWAREMEQLASERLEWARSLEGDIQRERVVFADAQQQIQTAQEHIRAIQEYNAALDQQLASHSRRLEGANALLQQLQSEASATRRTLSEVTSDRARLQVVERRLSETLALVTEERDTMLYSRSWRLTQPLRDFVTRLRQLRTRMRFQREQLRTLYRRVMMSLRTRGLRASLARVGDHLKRQPNTIAVPSLPDLQRSFEAFALPVSDQPTVSVVIPIYNKFDYTYACLRSIAEHAAQAPFEVIVVDDGSSDGSAEHLARIQGLRYHRNPENLGFVGACNAGAALARGSHLLFLNNDTVVTPGWLDALLETIETWPAAGLVGSMLVYPDGRLQEAGGIVFSDGSGWNYGRFGDPSDPAFAYPREVDYCSGASILLSRKLFETLGGFDTRYSPAYYEDTDLAFAVREAGYKVIYQPRSRIVHFEGVTSGTDTSSGIKRYQVVNQGKFLEHRANALARQPAPGTPIELAREHRVRGRILIIDACTPTPDQDSGSLRMMNLMRLLIADGWKVCFFADNRAWIDGYTQAVAELGVEILYHPWLNDPVAYFREQGKHFQAVVLSRHYIASNYVALVREFAPQAKLLFDTVDLHYLREQRAAALEDSDSLRREAERTRDAELTLIRGSDVTLVVSEVEKTLLATDAPGSRVEILSNVHQIYGCRRPFSERADLVFVGGFQHVPNVDAAQWFCREIMPLVRARLPQVTFHLIGSKAPAEIKELQCDGLVFHGFVEDIEPFMDGCRISVAPLRYGAGVKGKVNMAMSYGLPVVATSPAVEGMHVAEGSDVLVADNPEAFALAIIRLYQDEALWNQLSQGGLANVSRHFSFEAAQKALREILD